MVWLNDSEYDHSSVCFAKRGQGKEISALYRIMDYHRGLDSREHYEWAYWENTPEEIKRGISRDDPEDPISLYRAEVLTAMGANDDFIFLKWSPNEDTPNRPWVLNPYVRHYDSPALYEVINCPGVNDVQGLRDRLVKGWQYRGIPANQLLVAYAESDDKIRVVLIDRHDLIYGDGWLRLDRKGSLTAQRYMLNRDMVSRIPRALTERGQDRYVYESPSLPDPDDLVLIQPLSEYIKRYAQWFFDSASVTVGDADAIRVAAMVDIALKAPNRLESFLGAHIATSDITQIRQLLARMKHPDTEVMNGLIRETLKNDDAFVKQCRNEVLRSLDDEIAQRKTDLHQLEEDAKQQVAANDDLVNQEKQLNRQIEEIRQQIESERTKLNDIEQKKEQALSRLEEDAVLRLGLQATARFASERQSDPADVNALRPSRYPESGIPAPVNGFADALKRNLRQFGIASVQESADLSMLADGIWSTLSATHLLAVDSMFAIPLANALSYSMQGVPAAHVSVPMDWADSSTLDDLMNDEHQHVLVLDGLFDTVNENTLFQISRTQSKTITILPVGAYGNLRLVAREVWNRVFYVPTERYTVLPHSGSTPVFAHGSGLNPTVSGKTILAKVETLGKHIGGGLPPTTLVLPATVVVAGDLLKIKGTGQWISPHLTLQLSLYRGLDHAKSFANGCKDFYSCNTLLTRVWNRNGR
ncbi:Viral A-type inclusion protein repeat-containing protein [Bifidobacterium margollesii]|uniref:Viral A-type inclusion protein repeat-containing protein n=1 Tax=Bifidobacterium margollesii TaxID=2020964 RepID=A0A2N5J9P0_9BIFI|nr:hypothetical protein [Bifidobacterium margollesii]PLS30915.1 Viral A-type inclusion protein repeat-containing protein [Bifidobacterium margollesii]